MSACVELETLAAHPLGWPLRSALACLPRGEEPTVEVLDRVLGPRARVRFVEQPPRPRRGRRGLVDPESLYDARITLRGEVPTRPRNLHDRMNALVWATFPRAKRAIHRRQHALVAARIDPGARLPPARTRCQDAIAMLDEGGVALLATRDAAGALARAALGRDDGAVARAVEEGSARGVLFGHALYEHLARGRPETVGAMGVVLAVDGAPRDCDLADVDERLAALVADETSLRDPTRYGIVGVEPSVLGGSS